MRKFKTCLLAILLLVGTVVGTHAAMRPKTAEEAIRLTGAAEWSLVALGNNETASIGHQYASRLQDHLGIIITPKSWVINTTEELVDLLRDSESIRQEIAGADIIVLEIPAIDPPTFGRTIDLITNEICKLRSPSDALIRIFDNYRFGQEQYGNQWINANKELVQIATRYEVPVVKVSEVFYGISGGLDPVAQGYLGTGDSPRLTKLGISKIVDLLDEIGTGYGLYDCT